jgi:hypothetical protein
MAAIRAKWTPRERGSRLVDDRTRAVALGRRMSLPVLWETAEIGELIRALGA